MILSIGIIVVGIILFAIAILLGEKLDRHPAGYGGYSMNFYIKVVAVLSIFFGIALLLLEVLI